MSLKRGASLAAVRSTSLRGCSEFRKLSRTNRRSLLQAGSLGAMGLGMADWWRILEASERSAESKKRQPAKACIFLFMWGGPSQLDTFDMKPNAPAEIRGTFNPTATRVPGMQICEHFSRLAKLTDRIALVRSLTHDDAAHLSSGHATVTGNLAPVVKSDATPPSDKDSPHLGSLVSKIRPTDAGLPSFVTLPWKAYHPAAPGGEAPGQHGGWLGPRYDGMLLTGDPNDPSWRPSALSLPQDLTLDRMNSRVALLRDLDAQRAQLDRAQEASVFHEYQARAVQLLGSSKVRQAFDLSLEPDRIRDDYGRNIHGQCVLMARRLVEHGVPMVSINWHNDGRNFWDTHVDNFNRLQNDLIPPADRALSALLEDLEQRGMLEETLVVWVGEFGRNPKISKENAGREHWPRCYSGLLAGGGIRGGSVYGASDRHAAFPVTDPVSPQDLGATIMDALGIPTDAILEDREGRPHKIASGRVIESLL